MRVLKTNFSLWLLIIFLNICPRISTEMISRSQDKSCDPEDVALAQWFGEISKSVKSNKNTNQQLNHIQERFSQLEKISKEMRKLLADTNRNLEECVEDQHQLRKDLLRQGKRDGSGIGGIGVGARVSGSEEIVIQRRMDGSVDFQRLWSDYKEGFGDPSGEFFIGLDKLHLITNTRPYELLIVMEDWENDRRFARYGEFIVGSEAEKYLLKSLGKYSGSAGDSLSGHLGQKFSTKDQDNDSSLDNCAVTYTGAWWYNACHNSNLNGQYLNGTITKFAVGTHWLAFKGYYYSLKFVEMILRPT